MNSDLRGASSMNSNKEVSVRKNTEPVNEKLPKVFKEIGHRLRNTDEKLIDHDSRLKKLEGQESINAIEGGRLDKTIVKRATNIVGGYQSNAYQDGHTYAMISRELRKAVTRRFGVKSAKEVLRKDLDSASELVESWQPSSDISDDIALVNAGPRVEKKKSPKLTAKQRKTLEVFLNALNKHTVSSMNRLDQVLSSLDNLSGVEDDKFDAVMDKFDSFVDSIARSERPNKHVKK